jgi:2',3'-cyclic-nucleotide 2'-phosphodiesterase (5'-nucleotidase family)
MKRILLIIVFCLSLVACTTLSETSSYSNKNVAITPEIDSVSDKAYEAILAPYREAIQSKLTEVIAYSDTGLISYRPESPLSNLLSDLMLEHGVNFCKANYPDVVPQIALFNHGGIRSSIPKGEITIRNIFELMPFENELVIVLLTGQQVIELSNYIATRGGEGLAGITFGMNNNKAENIKVQGIKVDADRKYWLLASDYIANGGDGMKVLTWAEKRIDTGEKLRDIIIDHFKRLNAENKKVTGKADRRIYHVE